MRDLLSQRDKSRFATAPQAGVISGARRGTAGAGITCDATILGFKSHAKNTVRSQTALIVIIRSSTVVGAVRRDGKGWVRDRLNGDRARDLTTHSHVSDSHVAPNIRVIDELGALA